MSDLNNYSVDDEMGKYIDAFEIKQANLGMQSFPHSRRRYNPNTNRNDVLAQMENGGYIKVGDEELVSEQPSESLVANLETAAPEQPMMQENTDQSMVTPGASIESAMEYANTVKTNAGNVTADDMLAAGYDENTIKAIGIGAEVEPMVLSTQEIEDTLRNGGSFIEYDPTIRETGRVELSQYLMELAEDSLAEDLRAQGIRALNPEADTNATLTEDQIATLLEGERPRLENEARSLSGMFFGSPNSLGIGVGDFVTAGVMDIQEGARLFTQGRTTGGLDRSMGALLVLAGIAEATGVGMFIGKAIKKSIPAFRAGLSNVGERLNQPGEMPTVGSNLGNVGDVAKVEAPTENKPGIIAFHGSGADFNEFKLDMIGTGEGNQAYGYGLYFTDVKDIAEYYRAILDFNKNMKGKRITYKGEIFEDLGDTPAAEAAPPSYMAITNIAEEMNKYLPANPKLATAAAAKERLLKRIDADMEKRIKIRPEFSDRLMKEAEERKQALLDINPNDIELERGKVFEVELDVTPDKLLDYDLPLKEQPKILSAIDEVHGDSEIIITQLNLDPETATGGELIQALAGIVETEESAKAASEWMEKAGILGLKYLENSSRNTSGGNLIDVSKTDDGFRAKVAVENRQGGVGGSGRIVTTSKSYSTEEQAREWADQAINKADNNYVIFDDRLISILKKYGIAAPVAVSSMAVKSSDQEDET